MNCISFNAETIGPATTRLRHCFRFAGTTSHGAYAVRRFFESVDAIDPLLDPLSGDRAVRARDQHVLVARAIEDPALAFSPDTHDMGDPAGAVKHERNIPAPAGTLMIVDPFAGDRVEETLNPIGRGFYAASTMTCMPAPLAYKGPGLGAQTGEARPREVATKGGFQPLPPNDVDAVQPGPGSQAVIAFPLIRPRSGSLRPSRR